MLLQIVAPEDKYSVKCKPEDAALVVIGAKEPHITVTITLTSPVMREPLVAPPSAEAAGGKTSGWGSVKPNKQIGHWFFLFLEKYSEPLKNPA